MNVVIVVLIILAPWRLSVGHGLGVHTRTKRTKRTKRAHLLSADLFSDVDHSDKPGQIVSNFQKSSHYVIVVVIG